MMNPFTLPGGQANRSGPLTPWKEPAHCALYVDVDNTERSFQQFQAYIRNRDVARERTLILVHGSGGCGKSSLIHRCAREIQNLWGSDKTEIIDRTTELLEGHPALTRCDDLVRSALRQLRARDDFLSKQSRETLPQLSIPITESELRDAMEEISIRITRPAAQSRSIVLLPAKLEVSVELQTLAAICGRPGVILLMETDEDTVRELADDWNRRGAGYDSLILAVGPLEVDNGWRYVDARMQQTLGKENAPRFDPDGIQRYMQTRMIDSEMSVRELERVCSRLFDEAVAHRKEVIDYDDIRDLYVRRAGGLK